MVLDKSSLLLKDVLERSKEENIVFLHLQNLANEPDSVSSLMNSCKCTQHVKAVGYSNISSSSCRGGVVCWNGSPVPR